MRTSKGQNKPFDVFKKDGTYIKSFDYQFEAIEYLQKTYNIKTKIHIGEVLNRKRKSCHRFAHFYPQDSHSMTEPISTVWNQFPSSSLYWKGKNRKNWNIFYRSRLGRRRSRG